MALVKIETTESVTIRCSYAHYSSSLEKIKTVYIQTENISSIIEDEDAMFHNFHVFMNSGDVYLIAVFLSVVSDNSGIVKSIRNLLGMN